MIETGSIVYELSKKDSSITNFFVVHNLVGMASIDKFGDDD